VLSHQDLTWTIGTKGLRSTLLTMEPCGLLDVLTSTQVDGGGNADGVVDAGCGCQTVAAPGKVGERS